MNVKLLWAAIIVLGLLVLGEAGYIYIKHSGAKERPTGAELSQSTASENIPDAQWKELQDWNEKVRKQLNGGARLADRDFDSFFNDKFFSGKYDPFTEMERIHRQMLDTLKKSEQTLFGESWDQWYGRRMLMDQFKTEITRTDKDVTLTIQLPGLTAKSADINITGDRIKISFSVKTATEEKTAGGVIKKESSENYVKILPLPGDAVPGTGKVEINGEKVKMTFDRKKAKQ